MLVGIDHHYLSSRCTYALDLKSTFHDFLTLSWRRPLSYRNQSIDLLCKLMDWFLYDNGLRHERVKCNILEAQVTNLQNKVILLFAMHLKMS